MGNLFVLAATAISAFYPFSAGIKPGDIPVPVAFEHREIGPPAPLSIPSEVPFESRTVWVTAYSSSPDETDDTPFTTASGSTVRDGIVATNLLPFGTKIKIPEYFGDKVFVVEDRMHSRKVNVVDIWMPSKAKALRFGASRTEIHILKNNAAPHGEPLALN